MLSRNLAPVPHDEARRQLEVDRIASSRPWPAELDRIAAAAAEVAGTSGGVVTVIDRDRQLTAGAFNYGLQVIARAETMCARAIMAPGEVLCIPDLHADQRFARLGVARGVHAIRFYAGAPLLVRSQPVGMLCAIDADRRDAIGDEQRRALKRLARIASGWLERLSGLAGHDLAA